MESLSVQAKRKYVQIERLSKRGEAEKAVLTMLTTGEMTKKDLGERLPLSRRTLYMTVRVLVQKGLVRIRPSVRDTRQSHHALTDLGWQAVEGF